MDGDLYYDYNLDCQWTINAPKSHVISFEITNIDIEFSDLCENDFLSVRFYFENFKLSRPQSEAMAFVL